MRYRSAVSATPHFINVPSQVTGLTVTGVNKQALLSWTAPASADSPITDYLIEYKLHADLTWSTFHHSVSTSSKVIVNTLTNGSSYDFRVSAENIAGAGTASDAVSATPNAISTLAFVITGESNSGGIGLNSSATAHEVSDRPAVQITNLTSGNFLYEDLHIGVNNLRDHAELESYYDTSHGFELQLANSAEANSFPDNPQVYLTKTGQGGSRIAQWNVGGTYWTKHLQRTAAAKTQLPAQRQWVVWFSLGINNGIDGTPADTFQTALIAHINKIKADLPGSIIIMTEFEAMPANSGYPAINTVLRNIASTEANVFSVDTTGTATDGGNHWTYAGLKQVALSMVNITNAELGLIYPGLPTGLSAIQNGNQVSLLWTAPVANGGLSITDYLIEYKLHIDSTDLAGNSETYQVQTYTFDTSGGGFSAPYPTAPAGGFIATRDITNFQNKTVLHFGFGNDITNIAISDNINFTPATYINATSSVEWIATSTKIIYIKYCNKYGRCSNPISLQINAFVPIVSNSYKFYKNLSYRMTNSDVKELQKYLNTHGVTIAPSGAGSLGKETNYFGLLTYRAVVKFQEAHASDILTPNGLKKGTGYFGPSTRAFVNK